MNTKKKFEVVPKIPHTRTPDAPPARPTSILDARFPYTSSAETDLATKFKALGWKPPKPKRPKFGK